MKKFKLTMKHQSKIGIIYVNILVEIVALLFTILFLYTGISKIIDYSIFKIQLADSPLFKNIANEIAIILPISEFVVCILLLRPLWRLKGLYASLILMLVFSGYIIYILTVNQNLPCSCGGIIELLSWKGHLIFNGIMIILALISIILSKRNNEIKSDFVSN